MTRFLFAAILGWMLAMSAGCQPPQIELGSSLRVGDAFPQIEGTDLHGEPISIAQYRGKVVLLDFFGDW